MNIIEIVLSFAIGWTIIAIIEVYVIVLIAIILSKFKGQLLDKFINYIIEVTK